MSIVSAKAFVEKVSSDEDFKNKLSALKDAEARVKFVEAEGFDFTTKELAQVKEEQGLTDEELDNVAGGCGHVCLKDLGDLNFW